MVFVTSSRLSSGNLNSASFYTKKVYFSDSSLSFWSLGSTAWRPSTVAFNMGLKQKDSAKTKMYQDQYGRCKMATIKKPFRISETFHRGRVFLLRKQY